MRTPLLRYEIRLIHRRASRARAITFILLSPCAILAGLGLGGIIAQAGIIHTAALVIFAAALGWLLHSATKHVL